MPYTQLLNQLIDQSGLTAKEIAEQCGKQGQAITASYISILRKEANERIPSVEVSQALETVLGAPKDALVLEAYLDDAPEVLSRVLRKIAIQAVEAGLRMIDDAIPIDESIQAMLRLQMAEVPLSQLILSLDQQPEIKFDGNIMTSSELIDDTQLNISMQANVDFSITDSSMHPIMPEGSKVKLCFQDVYSNGEVVAVMFKGEKNLLYRKLYDTKDGKRMLMPLNPVFCVIEFEPENMFIFGRVEAVVTQL